VDFFGRAITVPSKGEGGNDRSGNKPVSRKVSAPKGYRIGYKFAEGNSAAVRKPVKIGYFL